MKWQKLLHGNCPRCSGKLQPIKDNVIVYECKKEECEFFLTEGKYKKIIMDKNHKMRKHLNEEEKEIIKTL